MQGEGRGLLGNEELRRHPSDGQQLRAIVIIVCLVEVVSDAEVGNLEVMIGGDEAVPGGEVAVNDPLGEEEGHAVSHLEHEAGEGMGREGGGLARNGTMGEEVLLQVSLREGRRRELVMG